MKKQTFISIVVLIVNFQLLISNCNAQTLFNKQYDFLKGTEVFSKIIFNNNQYYLGGRATDSTYYLGPTVNNGKVAIVKTDNNGNTIWKKRYGNELYNYNIGNGDEIGSSNSSLYFTGQYVDSLSRIKHYLFKFNSQGDSLLLKHYYENDTTIESYSSQCKVSDDGYIVISGSIDSSFYGNFSQMMLSKQDTNGNVIWQKGYGGSGYEDARSMDICFDKGYILGGFTTSYGGLDKDAYVVKTDSMGNFEWQKVYNTNEDDVGAVVLSTSDGGYLIGTTETQFTSGSAWYANIYFTKLDALGNQLWRKTYGGILRETYLASIIEVNGNYVGVYSKWFENEVIKLNSNGDSLFFEGIHHLTTPCYEQYEYAISLIPVNNGFALAGWVTPYLEYLGQSQHEISQDAWLITLDSNACQLPNKPYNLTATATYVGTDTLIDITWQYNPTSPNERFLVEWYNEDITTGTGYWRNIVNTCTFGTDGNYFLNSLSFTDTLSNQTKAKYRVLVIDTTNQLMSCHSEIIEIDLTVGIEDVSTTLGMIKIYPNPNNGVFNIEIKNAQNANVEIYNISGQLILQKTITQNSAKINLINSPKGMYFVKVKVDTEIVTKKIIYH